MRCLITRSDYLICSHSLICCFLSYSLSLHVACPLDGRCHLFHRVQAISVRCAAHLRGYDVVRDQLAGAIIQRCGWASCAGIKWGLSPYAIATNTMTAAHILDAIPIARDTGRFDEYGLPTQARMDLCTNVVLPKEPKHTADAQQSPRAPTMSHCGYHTCI